MGACESDGVILLHGVSPIGRTLSKLARFLEKQGYRTHDLKYPSTRKPIEDIVGYIHPEINEFAELIQGRVHFVAASMGALVVRAYLCRSRPSNIGRVVMIGPPNHGSELADMLKEWWLYRKIYGPAGQQLVTGFKDAEKLFGAVNYELGVIAGNRTLDPIASYIIGKPNDGRVSIESTRLAGMKEHIVIPANHMFFTTNRMAWHQTLQFLREGRFSAV
jgi:pimeloyl-ACP methyl ester carboxylesterase